MRQYKTSYLSPLFATLFLILSGFCIYRLELQQNLANYGLVLIVFFISKLISGVILKLGGIIINRIYGLGKANSSTKEKVMTVFAYYFILAILDVVGWTFYFYPLFLLNHQKDIVIIEFVSKGFILITSGYFCYLLLHEKFHAHKLVALIIYLVGLIATFVLLIYQTNSQFLSTFAWFLFGTTCCLGLIIKEIGEKWMMYYQFRNQADILVIEGIISTIGSIATYFLLFKKENDSVKVGLETILSDGGWLKVVMFMVCSGLTCLFNIDTNNKFFPSFRAIEDVLFEMQLFIYWEEGNNNLLVLFIGLTPMLIGCLIYNEVLVIPLCRLDENTKAAIDERARFEAQLDRRPSNMNLLPMHELLHEDDENYDEENEEEEEEK